MEDTHIHLDLVCEIEAPFKKISYYGVYDGHGGKTTAEIVKEKLHSAIFETQEFRDGKPEDSLYTGFQRVDQHVIEKANAEGWMNGTTAAIAMILDGTLYAANVGDAEASLVAVENDKLDVDILTYPHKASDSQEKKRIEELGGHVFFGRVFGALAVARAFGDSRYKQPKTSQNFVSAEPWIKSVVLNPNHKYLIIACDGLWDVCTHEQAADFVHKAYQSGKTSQEVAKALVTHALDLKTDDNVTVVVVKIDWEAGNVAKMDVVTESSEAVSATNVEASKEDETAKETEPDTPKEADQEVTSNQTSEQTTEQTTEQTGGSTDQSDEPTEKS
jgi:serine/threonine protein phosphatase PrpC